MSFKTLGLIGYPLSHSFSQKYFTEKFLKENIQNIEYKLFPIGKVEEITELLKQYPTLQGLNVTIPHKRAVLPFLTEIDSVAEQVGAVNTIKIKHHPDGISLKGYNTDITGFRSSIKPFLEAHHSKALILGTGGASQAVAYVLKELGVDFHYVSRKAGNIKTFTYGELNQNIINSFPLIINTTPLGMFPAEEGLPPIPYEFISRKHFLYDLIYNPLETAFLKKGKEKGALTLNGLDMLIGQAEEAWKIWTTN